MAEKSRWDDASNEAGPHALRRTLLGVLAGGGLLVAVMLFLAGMAVAMGLIAHDDAGRLHLGPWLVLEIAGGALASILAGALSRRIARRYRGPVVLAVGVLCIGLLEAAEILHHAAVGAVAAPTWLVLLAPLVTGTGVLLGGWLPGTRCRCFQEVRRPLLLTEALRYASPVLVLAVAALLSLCVLPGLAVGAESLIVASALTLDFTVVVPGLVLVMIVRARRAPWIVLLPTFVVGYAVAVATIPSQHHALLQVIRLLVVPAEICVIVYLVVRTRRAWANGASDAGDFATRFRVTARKVLASRIPADILTTEISLLYYAFTWRRPAPPQPGAFTVHREVGYLAIVIGLLMVLGAETVAVHLLVSQWSGLAAWVLTSLSIYACIWLVGDYRAMTARPLRVTATHLSLRVGVRWEADVPRACIEAVELLAPATESPKSDTLVAALLGQPNVRLRLHGPLEVTGLYGLRKTVQEVWLSVDGAATFCKFLQTVDAS